MQPEHGQFQLHLGTDRALREPQEVILQQTATQLAGPLPRQGRSQPQDALSCPRRRVGQFQQTAQGRLAGRRVGAGDGSDHGLLQGGRHPGLPLNGTLGNGVSHLQIALQCRRSISQPRGGIGHLETGHQII